MEEIDHEMKFLADHEVLMTKSQQLQEKRLALQEMRKKMNKLRGMNSHSVIKLEHKSVNKSPSKPVKKTKVPLEPKAKIPVESKLTIRSSASGRSSHIGELTSSDSDYEINTKSLRKDKPEDQLSCKRSPDIWT